MIFNTFQSCSFFTSFTVPLKLAFKNVDVPAGDIYSMFKVHFLFHILTSAMILSLNVELLSAIIIEHYPRFKIDCWKVICQTWTLTQVRSFTDSLTQT